MDIKEYISSGILECYALGLCNGDEMREVEAMCKQHPELKLELEKVQRALHEYSLLHKKNPPGSLKNKIFDEIDSLEKTNTGKVLPIASNRTLQYTIAASIALFLLSAIANIILYNKWQAADKQITELNAEKTLLSDNLRSNQVKLDATLNNIDILSDTSIKRVIMKGVEKAPQSLAFVYWNRSKGEVYLEVKNLPKPELGKQYQLWAIVDGKPVDAGMVPIANSDSTLIKMKEGFISAQAFAITLEKEGGTPSPTLTEMYVVGGI